MNRNRCAKSVLKTAGISILAALFHTACEDNGVTVVTPDVSTFTDGRDGKIYKKVQIGDQIWMAENLRYEADGSVCYGEGGSDTFSILEPVPDRDNTWTIKYITLSEHCDIYGRLYDWNTAMNGEHSSSSVPSGVEGVCPVGWHIPSDAEWAILIDYIGINAGTKLKAREWHDTSPEAYEVGPSPDGTDKYRFTALPGGMGSHHDGKTSGIHGDWNGYWWTATEAESDELQAWNREIMGSQTGVTRGRLDKHAYFLSVRCVHD